MQTSVKSATSEHVVVAPVATNDIVKRHRHKVKKHHAHKCHHSVKNSANKTPVNVVK